MDFFERINKDVMAAMKAKDKERLNAVRAIKSELLLMKTAEGAGETFSEADGIKAIQKLIKQRKDSAATYQEQGRTDLSEKELQDVPFMEEYLPKQLTDSELEAAISVIIANAGVSSMKEMGKVIGMANKELAGQAEGKRIADCTKKLLS